MGFWVFMVLSDLAIPLIMLLFGKIFSNQAPGEINMAFGYRTSRSMKNRDTWEFAHKYIGKIWYLAGLILLPGSVVPMLFVIGKDEDIVGTLGAILCGIQLAVLIGSIFPTEHALKKTFDKYGRRRSKKGERSWTEKN